MSDSTVAMSMSVLTIQQCRAIVTNLLQALDVPEDDYDLGRKDSLNIISMALLDYEMQMEKARDYMVEAEVRAKKDG